MKSKRESHDVRIFKGSRLARFNRIELHIHTLQFGNHEYKRHMIVSPQSVHKQWLQTLELQKLKDIQVITPVLFCSMAFKNLPPTLFMVDELFPDQLRKVFECVMRERLKYELIEL